MEDSLVRSFVKLYRVLGTKAKVQRGKLLIPKECAQDVQAIFRTLECEDESESARRRNKVRRWLKKIYVFKEGERALYINQLLSVYLERDFDIRSYK